MPHVVIQKSNFDKYVDILNNVFNSSKDMIVVWNILQQMSLQVEKYWIPRH